MTNLELALRTVNLLCIALVAGSALFTHTAIVPILRSWSDSMSLSLHHDMVRANPDRVIKPAAALALLAAVLALVLADDDLPGVSLVLTIVGIALQIGVFVISQAVNQPINRRVGRQPSEAVLPQYRALRARWDRANLSRTAVALVSFGCYIVAALAAV